MRSLASWILIVLCTLLLVASQVDVVAAHHGGSHDEDEDHEQEHDEHHHYGSDETNDDFDDTVKLPDEETETDQEISPKFLNIRPWASLIRRSKPEKLIIFNIDRYSNWSDWSECDKEKCIEMRFRVCKDSSWENPISNRVQTTSCLSKFFAEKRTCQNVTQCNVHAGSQIVANLTDTCGIRQVNQIEQKILGGEKSAPHSWPWAVRLSFTYRSMQPITFCGGTLIAPQWIVTAAHCLLVENKRMPVGKPIRLSDHMRGRIYVHLGDHDKSKVEDSQQDVRVDWVILHPNYHRKLITDGYDIALLHLTKPIAISPEIGYACLPTTDQKFEPGTKCYATGWGKSQSPPVPTFDNLQSILDSLLMPFPGSMMDTWPGMRHPMFPLRYTSRGIGNSELHEVELPIISNDKCRRFYAELTDDLHVCAGQKGKDTCAGDSGGGLYCQAADSNRWFLAGVTSFGLARGCGLNPGVYTALASHMAWIQKQMATPIN